MPGRLPAPGGAGEGNGGAAAAGVVGIGFDLGAGGVAVRPRGIRAAVPFGRPLVRWPRVGIATPAPPSGPGAGSGLAAVGRGRSVLASPGKPSHTEGPTGARLPLVWPGWVAGTGWPACAERACGGCVRSGWLSEVWCDAGWFSAAGDCCAGWDCCGCWVARREPPGIPLAWREVATAALGSAAGRCVGAAGGAPPGTGLGIR
jgi:hypothetical protein